MSSSKLALVTGASSGIGRQLALELAKDGYHLILLARRQQALESLQKTIQERYQVSCHYLVCDLTKRDELKRVIDQSEQWCESKNLHFHLLVNNAGSGVWDQFTNIPLEVSQRDIDLNIQALTTLTFLFIENRKHKAQKGAILNIASVAAFLPVPNYAVYAGTKSYVVQFSEILSYELKGSGIDVCCVCPGGVKTEFIEKAGQSLKSQRGVMTASKVAQFCLKVLKAKKVISIPGFINRLSLIIRLLPRKLRAVCVKKIMSTAVEKL